MTHAHNYIIISSGSRATVEVCSECKKRLVTKMDKKGRIDNKAYLEEHVRDTAQPTGATAKVFNKYYETKQGTHSKTKATS
jgi:hypothetical protein